jgi:hypothetical protein
MMEGQLDSQLRLGRGQHYFGKQHPPVHCTGQHATMVGCVEPSTSSSGQKRPRCCKHIVGISALLYGGTGIHCYGGGGSKSKIALESCILYLKLLELGLGSILLSLGEIEGHNIKGHMRCEDH